MVSIREVAKRAGVSIATVSATANGSDSVKGETRQRVQEAIEALGYRPNGVARSLRLGRTGVIGLVVSEITNPFFAEIARVVEDTALGAAKVVVVCNTNESAEREAFVLEALRVQRIAGLLIAPAGTGSDYAVKLSGRIPQNTVVIDRQVSCLNRDFVGLDNLSAGRMAAEYLLRLGHRHIGFIAGPKGIGTAEDRLTGFAGALREGGVAFDDTMCPHADFRSELANDAAAQMLTRRDRPSALVAANNFMALGIMQSIAALGFNCPNDVSVVGIDDSAWNIALRPQLTSVAQPVQAIARQAIDWLLDRLEAASEAPARVREFSPTLVVRGSCAPR